MTVTINTLGTNSRQIVISGETSATNIIDAVNTSLTALGWTLIDTVTSGSRGLQTTKVYSAPNADTYTTKYMIVRYDLQRQYWFVSCAEGWNTTTNVATNECWYGNRQILLPLQYSNCILYVFATARYACFMGTVQGEPSAWQGVFEFERESPEDIADHTVPCFGWTSSLTIGEPYGNVSTSFNNGVSSSGNGFVACGFAPPRTKNGFTGVAAAGNFTILTTIGSYTMPKGQIGVDFTSGGVTQTINSHTSMLGSFGEGQSYVWDSNKTLISNIKLAGYTTNYVVGKIYGLKVTGKLGSVLDTTTVPVDANLFYSAVGSNTTHYLLGMNGGYSDKIVVGTNRVLRTSITTSSFGTTWQTVIVGGRFMYFSTSTGFHKYDTQSQGLILNILPANAYYGIKFDGENSLYVATVNTIFKINLSDDTYTTLSITGNWTGLALDDDNLYVSSSTAGSTVSIKKITLSTFTENTTYSITSGAAGNYVTHMSTADYSGFLYVGTLAIGLSGAANRITRILISTGTQSQLTISTSMYWEAGPPTSQFSLNATGYQPIGFDGENLYFLNYSSYNSSGYFRNLARIAKVNIYNNFSILVDTGYANYYNPFVEANVFNNSNLVYGAGEIIPFSGLFIYGLYGASGIKFAFNDPRTSINIAPANINSLDADNSWTGMICTDQCNLYATSGTTKIIKYYGTMRNYNFNGAQSSNILIAQ